MGKTSEYELTAIQMTALFSPKSGRGRNFRPEVTKVLLSSITRLSSRHDISCSPTSDVGLYLATTVNDYNIHEQTNGLKWVILYKWCTFSEDVLDTPSITDSPRSSLGSRLQMLDSQTNRKARRLLVQTRSCAGCF